MRETAGENLRATWDGFECCYNASARSWGSWLLHTEPAGMLLGLGFCTYHRVCCSQGRE